MNKRQNDIAEKNEIKNELADHRTETDRFREIFDEFVHDSTHLNEFNCKLDFDKSMDHVLKSRGKHEEPEDLNKTMNSLEI
jgi:hypothetical protein